MLQVYLTSLEVVKDGVSKVGHQLELTQTATAGLANFAGGAAASLSTQLVAVPIDVISQRQMVHGVDTSSRQRAAAAQRRGTAGAHAGAAAGATGTPGAQAGATGAGASGGSGAQAAAETAAGGQQRSYSTGRSRAGPAHGEHGAGRVQLWRWRQGDAWHAARAGGQGRCSSTAAVVRPQGISGMDVARTILKEEGIGGFYR